jgi:hypothetical protein
VLVSARNIASAALTSTDPHTAAARQLPAIRAGDAVICLMRPNT